MRRTILAAAAMTLLVATFSGVAAAQVTVKVGDLGIISDASLYIAVARGHFKERGIDVPCEFIRAFLIYPGSDLLSPTPLPA